MFATVKHAALVLSVALCAMASCPVTAEAQNGNAPRVLPPQSTAYGHTLTEWLTIHLRWLLGGADPAQGQVNRVQLLPLPGPGDCTVSPDRAVCAIEVTLRPGTPFVLPIVTLYGERYADGQYDDRNAPFFADPFGPAGCVPGGDQSCVQPIVSIDGRVVIWEGNKESFYVPPRVPGEDWPGIELVPEIVYPEPTPYGSVAAAFFKGVGFVGPPLPVGDHTIRIVAPWYVAGLFSGTSDFTWTIRVTPR